jgi:hypothetical protein
MGLGTKLHNSNINTITKQGFVNQTNPSTITVDPNYTGWKEYNNAFVYFKNGSYATDPKYGFASISFFPNGNVKSTTVYTDGVKHKEDGPAHLEYDPMVKGLVIREEFYFGGRKYEFSYWRRKVEEAKRKAQASVKTDHEKWLETCPDANVFHKYDNDKEILYSKYDDMSGLQHSASGPAQVSFDAATGRMLKETYFLDGKIHREDGPAVVKYLYDGSGGVDIESIYYFKGACYGSDSRLWNLSKYRDKHAKNLLTSIKMMDGKFTEIYLRKDQLLETFPVYAEKNLSNLAWFLDQQHIKENMLNIEKLGDRYVAWANISSKRSEATSWYGPGQIDLNPETGELLKGTEKYYYKGVVLQTKEEWFKRISVIEKGIPVWLRHTELKAAGLENEIVHESTTKEKAKEFVQSFLDNEKKKIAYVYEDNCYILVKENNQVFQKRIPLRPRLINDNTQLDMGWENETGTYQMAEMVFGEGIKGTKICSKEAYLAAVTNSNIAINSTKATEQILKALKSDAAKTAEEAADNAVGDLLKDVDAIMPNIEEELKKLKDGESKSEFIMNKLIHNKRLFGILEENKDSPEHKKASKNMDEVAKNVIQPATLEKMLKDLPPDTKILTDKPRIFVQLGQAGKPEYIVDDILVFHDPVAAGEYVSKTPVSSIITGAATAAAITGIASLPSDRGSMLDTVKATAFSDAREVAKRIAAEQIVKVVQSMLVQLLSANKTKKQQESIRQQISDMIASNNGRLFIGFVIGMFLPFLKQQLPEKYHELLEEMSQEFRVQSETEVATKLLDSMIGPTWDALKFTFSTFMNNPEQTGIRIKLDGDENPVLEPKREEEQEEITAAISSNKNNLLN